MRLSRIGRGSPGRTAGHGSAGACRGGSCDCPFGGHCAESALCQQSRLDNCRDTRWPGGSVVRRERRGGARRQHLALPQRRRDGMVGTRGNRQRHRHAPVPPLPVLESCPVPAQERPVAALLQGRPQPLHLVGHGPTTAKPGSKRAACPRATSARFGTNRSRWRTAHCCAGPVGRTKDGGSAWSGPRILLASGPAGRI